MKYIIGNNDASWFLLYLLEDTKLILHKTLEELDYNSGPKLIYPSLIGLVKKEFEDATILEFERFYDDRGKCTSVMPKNFEKLYSLYTRGKTTVEESYNNNYSKYQKFISINSMGPEDSYDVFFKKIKEITNDRIIDKSISEIDLTGTISLDTDVINFEKIISTINIIDLVELEKSGKIRNSIIDNNNLDEEILNRFMDLKFFSDIPSVKEKVLDWLNDPKLNGGYKEGYNGLKIQYDKAVSQILSKLKKQKN